MSFASAAPHYQLDVTHLMTYGAVAFVIYWMYTQWRKSRWERRQRPVYFRPPVHYPQARREYFEDTSSQQQEPQMEILNITPPPPSEVPQFADAYTM